MPDATREELLNGKFAESLRKLGFDAQPEQRLKSATGRTHQVDVLIDLEEYAVAIEAEYQPATGEADALKRFEQPPLLWRGIPIQLAYSISYPAHLKELVPAQAYRELSTTSNLEIRHATAETMSFSSPIQGSVARLAELLHNYWIQTDVGQHIDEIVSSASTAIGLAADSLKRSSQSEVRDVDTSATKALVWLNALLFQFLLNQSLDSLQLPHPHTGKRIPVPNPDSAASKSELMSQWKELLDINWWPIFYVARESLKETPPRSAHRALDHLKPVANAIAESGIIRRHDVAGRILHRLLDTRKFLATNYTTIPAAIILSALAFDPKHAVWKGFDLSNSGQLEDVAIVDPACGSGTLLKAAYQEIHGHLRRKGFYGEDIPKRILESSLYGFDVVPAAVHLAASTLSMAECSQLVADMNLFRMLYGVHNEIPRLGSLDMLVSSPSQGNAGRLALHDGQEFVDGVQTSGTGERIAEDLRFPNGCKLVIANPPYTRAGGPGDEKNTAWNPIFGALLDHRDEQTMKDALNETLRTTPAGVYQGLGSAFIVLADQNIGKGGRIAFVLPSAMINGSAWRPIRRLLLEEYKIDWIVTSHDPRKIGNRAGQNARIYASFSESTSMSEVLLVATKGKAGQKHKVRFVNLKVNPTSTIDAISVARVLLQERRNTKNISTPGKPFWGQLHAVSQYQLSPEPWINNCFVSSDLIEYCLLLRTKNWIKAIGDDWSLGPGEMDIKNPKQGLFTIDESPDASRHGYMALWHHSGKKIRSMFVQPNAHLTPREDRTTIEIGEMLKRGSRLHCARELRTNTQSVAAAITRTEMLGVRSWISMNPRQAKNGLIELACLWFNSTPGLLLRLTHAHKPYPGRHTITHSALSSLLALDFSRLSVRQTERARDCYSKLETRSLKPFCHADSDSVRSEIDRFICGVTRLNLSNLEKLKHGIVQEPMVNAGTR